jgi:hypothetical protein
MRSLRRQLGFTGRMVPMTNRPRYELQRRVDELNGKLQWVEELGPEDTLVQERRSKETPQLFRELVQAWRQSGPDLVKFSLNQRKMWADIARYWIVGRRLNPLQLVGAPGGGAAIFMNSRPERDPYEEALRLFIELLLNPDCDKLAGPCCRCDNYYIRRSVRNKVYCSRSCGTRATALSATKRRRDEERSHKLYEAARLSQRWISSRTKLDWKQWVSHNNPEISPKFLTRAVNSGDLAIPIRPAKEN